MSTYSDAVSIDTDSDSISPPPLTLKLGWSNVLFRVPYAPTVLSCLMELFYQALARLRISTPRYTSSSPDSFVEKSIPSYSVASLQSSTRFLDDCEYLLEESSACKPLLLHISEQNTPSNKPIAPTGSENASPMHVYNQMPLRLHLPLAIISHVDRSVPEQKILTSVFNRLFQLYKTDNYLV